ncbi:MAG: DUF4202 family protein [Candidatus Pacebacteria bacterium]|nr:DUF4202 family protein [Candidatus Paceibacterota bacterium]MBP9715793.1 DUF4202 family protein [Candidatus Paceibacterota bacterium]
MDIYNKTVEYVDQSFKGKQKAHFERTVYWYEKFIPNITEAHKIAAYSHDIERAFRSENEIVPENYLDQKFLKNHQEKGGKIMFDFLQKENIPEEVINKVVNLISKHEVGGDEEQNALMDADSISFFETNAEMFVNKKAPIEGHCKVKEKLDWMFNRISSSMGKEIARPNYEKWIKELEKFEN